MKGLFKLIVIITVLISSAFILGKKKKEIKVITAIETFEGKGARVNRLYPTQRLKHHDPFVIMDEFFVEKPAGFPDHTHKGFEAITYMLNGSFRHKDNLGNDSTIGTGGAQRFTAGRGIIHSEMPGSDGVNQGIQLWINLPQSLKKINPEYQPVGPTSIPQENKKNAVIRHIVGHSSPLKLKTDVIIDDIMADSLHKIKYKPLAGYQGYVYVINGKIEINRKNIINKGQACIFYENEKEINIKALSKARYIYICGKMHHEPIKQRGPFVY